MGVPKPKVVSLDVRPLQVSHLCFEVGGILGELKAELGAPAAAFDFAGFYAALGANPTVTGDPSRLLYDSSEIRAKAGPPMLAALRAEPGKAVVDSAINARQNAYYAKYANAPAIIAKMNEFYSPAALGSKPNRLVTLRSLAADQASELRVAYGNDGRTGVVKTTTSTLDSTIMSGGQSVMTGQNDQEAIEATGGGGSYVELGKLPEAGAGWGEGTRATATKTGTSKKDEAEGTSQEITTSGSTARQAERIENTDYGYRTPHFESQAQYERAQISLMDEQFTEFIRGQNLPNLTQVFANELKATDNDVFRLQIAFLSTILLSPIPGTVTGIYKNPGDAVRAGEPVVRVENSAVVLLVATVVYRGRISIGASVTVETALFDAAGPRTKVTGRVVAVRGQREDDQWEVIVQCDNLGPDGEPILPLGYHFDYDDTTMLIA